MGISYELGLYVRESKAGHWGSSMGLRDSRWSAMLKCRGQRVEVYLLGEGGLGWFKRVTSGAFPGGFGRSDTFGTSISCYKTCMRCSFGYLVSWRFLAVAARCILEGPNAK